MNEEERREEQQEPMEPPVAAPEQGPVLMRQALEAERKALDEEKAAFAAQRLEDAVGRELASRGLSTAFARFLTGQDEAQALEQVELFEALFRESLAQAVTERM
ncbi:MAG: DUF4355 domain-containing protein, partial [Clostridiales bacterium]|nr:DUF4355 domain-containing protein [Clostridiales bacterium]